MTDVDPALAAAEVARAVAEAGIDLSDPGARQAVMAALNPAGPDRRITAAERARYALELRYAGATYEDIARLVGWKSKGAAHKAVTKALREVSRERAEDVRTLELGRLDALLAGGLFRRARAGEPVAIDRVLSIMDRRRRYVPGLEVPVGAEITGVEGGPLVVELAIPMPEKGEAVLEGDLGGEPVPRPTFPADAGGQR